MYYNKEIKVNLLQIGKVLQEIMRYRRSKWEIKLPILVFLTAILWLESVYRLFYVDGFFGRGLLHIILFSIPIALIFTEITKLFDQKKNHLVAMILLGITTFWYMIQAVYHTIFSTVFVTATLDMAGQAMGNYWREAISGIIRTSPILLLMALPVVALYFLRIWFDEQRWESNKLTVVAVLIVVTQIIAVLTLNIPTGGLISMREVYRESFIPDTTVTQFGVLTTLRLDITQSIFGLEETEDEDSNYIPPSTGDESDIPVMGDASVILPTVSVEVPIVYEPNVMDIDFDDLIANETNNTLLAAHKYFAGKEPTMQNEYTGMFEGKNLILLTGEAFWIGAVNEKYTPTLYKLANEAFVFENFYNPLWYYSTADGEYAHTTGLIPTNQVKISQKYAGQNDISMYFSMGNQLGALGYPTMAYHNNTATYYGRHLSHPNLGYEYIASDTGLDVKMTWPQSDLEMMELTLPQALAGEKPFHNYYMTISGHLNYNFTGNQMAKKHKDAVADLDMSDAAKAYIACHIELDKALEYTLKTLEEAGELENTVIVLSGDHYPYGLDDFAPAMDELAGEGTQESEWEKHRSSLILWSGDMANEEPIIIEKPCSSIDVNPTLSNLFGLDYDSRLMSGQDILSDAPGLVVFNNKSFITELGRYSAKKDEFYPNEGAVIPEEYASDVYSHITSMMKYATRILVEDYYREIGLAYD